MHDDRNSQPEKTSATIRSITSTTVRFIWWLTLMILVPFFILPEFKQLFDEYGITIPEMTELTIAVCDYILSYFILYAVVIVPAVIAWQVLSIVFKKSRIVSKLIVVDWILLLIVTLFLVVALGLPVITIAAGITGKN